MKPGHRKNALASRLFCFRTGSWSFRLTISSFGARWESYRVRTRSDRYELLISTRLNKLNKFIGKCENICVLQFVLIDKVIFPLFNQSDGMRLITPFIYWSRRVHDILENKSSSGTKAVTEYWEMRGWARRGNGEEKRLEKWGENVKTILWSTIQFIPHHENVLHGTWAIGAMLSCDFNHLLSSGRTKKK